MIFKLFKKLLGPVLVCLLLALVMLAGMPGRAAALPETRTGDFFVQPPTERLVQTPQLLLPQRGPPLFEAMTALDSTVAPNKGAQAATNRAAGDAWEAELIQSELPLTQRDIRPEITVRSFGPSGRRTRLDAVGTDSATGEIRLTEGKASPTAPFTPNQKVVHPELETHGGVVVGKGKPPYGRGTIIPPTKVNVRRKP